MNGKLSYSKLKVFLECPAKYNYKYTQHLPEPSSQAMQIGSIVHRALEWVVINNPDKNITEPIINYDFKTNMEYCILLPSEQRECKSLYTNYLRRLKIDRDTLVGVEFRIIIDAEFNAKQVFELEWGNTKNFFFRAILDRLHIDTENKIAKIYDYKTSWVQQDYSLQATSYAYAVSKLYPESEVFEINFEYIRQATNNQKIIISKSQLKEFETILKTIAENIENFTHATIGAHCVNCAYHSKCSDINMLDDSFSDIAKLGDYITITEARLKKAREKMRRYIVDHGAQRMDDGTQFFLDDTPTQVIEDVDQFKDIFMHLCETNKFLQGKDINDYIVDEKINTAKLKAKVFHSEEFDHLWVEKAKTASLKRGKI